MVKMVQIYVDPHVIWTHFTLKAIVQCPGTPYQGRTNVMEGAVGFV